MESKMLIADFVHHLRVAAPSTVTPNSLCQTVRCMICPVLDKCPMTINPNERNKFLVEFIEKYDEQVVKNMGVVNGL